MQRKKKIISIFHCLVFMRSPRFFARIRPHSSSLRLSSYSGSAPAFSRASPISEITQTSSDSSGCSNKPAYPRGFQFDSVARFTGGGRLLLYPFANPSLTPTTFPSRHVISFSPISPFSSQHYSFHRDLFTRAKEIKIEVKHDHSQRAVTTALWCNFLVFSLKFGVWMATSSHVMLAEVVHSVADFANQALLAYGLSSSRRAPDALHPYGYIKERFVWSLISAVGIFCLGSGATIVHGIQNLWTAQPPVNIQYAALIIGGSFLIEGASLVVAIHAVRKNAAAEGMTVREYVWCGHDPTAVAVMMEDSAAVASLVIAGASLVAVNTTGNAIYDPIGSIIVGNILGMVAIFLIQRNRQALIGRAIDNHDMERVLHFLQNDPVVDAVYDCKSEVIGPGIFRFKAEIDFNGVVLVQNYLSRTKCDEWTKRFRDAANKKGDAALLKVMSSYGEEVVTALGSEVDRLEKEIQQIVPGIRHVDIEAHNPIVPTP